MEKMLSLENTASIISNKAFQRLAEKTQVVFPKNGREETVQNRLTHSYQVANSAKITEEALKIPGVDIDYKHALFNTCLLHDIGHPPFGHEGATLLDQRIKELGLKEGFSDNNNNFVVIQKNQIPICDYTVASLIKYPEKLYPSQEEELSRKLELAIRSDIMHFEKHVKIYEQPVRTLTCEIMDEADRNTYVCSDLADCFSLGLEDYSSLEELLEADMFFSQDIKSFLVLAITAVKTRSKSMIKKAFNELNILLNKNYFLGDNLYLQPINQELILLREELFKIEKAIFIESEEVISQREEHIGYLNEYIDWIIEGNYPSKTYRKIIERTKGADQLRAIRDMIGETTDWYVINFHKKNK